MVFSSDHFGFVAKLVDEFGDVGNFDAGTALGGFGDFEGGEPWGDVDAKVGGLEGVERLFLGFHDVGEGGVARFVEAQVGRHHRWQGDFEGFEAAVDFAGDGGFAVRQNDFGGEGGLRPVLQGGEHLAGLVGVVVDGLFAADDELRLFFVAEGFQ